MPINVAPTGLARDLIVRANTGKPIRIGLIGSGEMGTDIVTRVAHMPGIEIGAICDLNMARARSAVDIAFLTAGHHSDAASAEQINSAIEARKVAITANSEDNPQ